MFDGVAQNTVLAIIDRLVENRFPAATAAAQRLRRARPDADPEQLAHLLVRRAARQLAGVAAMSGGAAATPGIGTTTAMAAVGADLAFTVTRLGEMVMAIGVAYGHVDPTIEQRQAWVLQALGVGPAGTLAADGLVAEVDALHRRRRSSVERVNAAMGSRLGARAAARGSNSRVTRLIPYGIGAGVGAAANWMAARTAGRAAIAMFEASGDEGTSPRWDGDVIDLDGVEVDPTTGRPLDTPGR